MHVILTHEQADFDGVASLLGAYLTQEKSLPLLPRTLNRNVSEFIKLYGSDLPFETQENFQRKKISTITLVDTQSLVTIRGFGKNTNVIVFDHHKKRAELSENWDFHKVNTSACTTFFVEQIIEDNNVNLTIIEATLLLLGIYEDTGTLTYADTTYRDAAAVAFLLEKGASLKIANEFLNPPLTDAQQMVFTELLDNAEFLKISGLEIFVSSAKAESLEEEVSTIAHKLVDMVDPDALFIFVSIKEGIRLVARSSTDQIDTSQIAERYNGGGHSRASAALIKHKKNASAQLENLTVDFKKKLPQFVQPQVTVKDIMSKKPLVLSPKTTAEEAKSLMQRFGYEGYPVIEDNKVIGLLNRRAVDKAVSHMLPINARNLMDSGNYHVHPQDSLDRLQAVMAESGWGQIPVIEENEKGEVIGIATRTDLLKTLSGTKPQSSLNLAEKMKSDLTEGQIKLLEMVSKTAVDLDFSLFIVGGFVRDLILGTPSPDLDFVVEGDAIQLAKELIRRFGGKITTHKKFGTAKWWPKNSRSNTAKRKLQTSRGNLINTPDTIDLISSRTEYYEKPTALPTIKRGSIKLDLHRRDFTINTLAIRLDGRYFGDVYDHWGGLNDLKNKKVRVLHSLSFVDDPTRMLRAIRFEQRFGFKIESRTLELLRNAIPLLDEVSGDRIRHEIDQFFLEENCVKMLGRANKLGLIQQINPKLSWDADLLDDLDFFRKSKIEKPWTDFLILQQENTQISGGYLTLLFRMLPPDLDLVVKRLRLKSDLKNILINANGIWHNQNNLASLSNGHLAAEFEKAYPLALYVNWLFTKNKVFKEKLFSYTERWRNIHPTISGDSLKAFGIPPGPIYRKILQEIRIAWVNGEINNQQEEQEFLKDFLDKIQ